MLQPSIAQRQQLKRTLGWRRDCLVLRTRDGLDLPIEWSNQVWQVDHTRSDVLVVDQSGSLLGRPWLTIVVDTYSRCMMGIHLGFDAPSAGLCVWHYVMRFCRSNTAVPMNYKRVGGRMASRSICEVDP